MGVNIAMQGESKSAQSAVPKRWDGVSAPNSLAVGPNSVSAFLSTDDYNAHGIVATSANQVKEIYFYTGGPSSYGVATLYTFGSSIRGVGSYFSTWDNYRHAIVALSNNQIWEVYYHPTYGLSAGLLTTASGSIGFVTAYYSKNDGFAHVVYTVGPNIYHYRFNPYCSSGCGTNYGTKVIGSTLNMAAITAWWGDDYSEHVVTSVNGTIGGLPRTVAMYEFYYTGNGAVSTGALPGATFYPTLAIAGMDLGSQHRGYDGNYYRYMVDIAAYDSAAGVGVCKNFFETYQYVPGTTGNDTVIGSCPSAGYWTSMGAYSVNPTSSNRSIESFVGMSTNEVRYYRLDPFYPTNPWTWTSMSFGYF